MAKLSSLLKLRGTRFSPTRREAVATSGQPSSPSSSSPSPRKSGMAKTVGRFKRQAVEIVETAKLKSVEAMHPGAENSTGNSSGVYVIERTETQRPDDDRRARTMNPLLEHVTLVVYGWHNVEPGTLAWVFPSVGAAVAAARAMTNAVKWAIVAGRRDDGADTDLDDARAHGSVLLEQP